MYTKNNFFTLKNIAFLVLSILLYQTGYANSMPNRDLNFKNDTFQTTIKGIVLDESGVPLPGATIILKGTSTGASTDFDGVFSINAAIGQTLQVSFVGYESQYVDVTSTDLKINLKPLNAMLDEVLIVGYGQQTKKDLTGAVTQLSTGDFKKGVNVSPDNLIQGKVAGVRVVQSSGELVQVLMFPFVV
ncbi:SusC outer membrane protein [Algibacter lectus]|uniref:SusC outer membrane protein n=2 Tax=Algibacter lectus TaxID=221126 RepID=A0A090VFD4_9FLAO|nr:SusC outer membrane protein [Algibacter lectus]